MRPLVVSVEPVQRLQRDVAMFRAARLPVFIKPADGNDAAPDPIYGRMLQRYGR